MSSNPKFPKPELFTAEGSLYDRVKNAKEFIAKCQVYFSNTPGFAAVAASGGTTTIPNKARTSYALSLCAGSAFLWARTFIKYLDIEPANATAEQKPFTDAINDWNKWQELFIAQFGPIDEDEGARIEIEQLKYKGNISELTAAFTNLSYETGWNDKGKRDKLITKLPEWLIESISQSTTAEPTDYNAYVAWINKIGTRAEAFREKQRRKILSEQQSYTPRYSEYEEGEIPEKFTRMPNTFSNSQGTRLSQEQHVKYMQERRCFNCGQTGHIRNNCPNSPEQAPKPSVQNTPNRAITAGPHSAGATHLIQQPEEDQEESDEEEMNISATAWYTQHSPKWGGYSNYYDDDDTTPFGQEDDSSDSWRAFLEYGD